MSHEADTPLSEDAVALEARARVLSQKVGDLLDRLEGCYRGSRQTLLVPLVHATLAGCHVLLEGLPGLGKTLLAKALAATLGGSFSRIQCTPDLMPSDVTGTEILEDGDRGGVSFRFRQGPIFGNLVLADEINRATPKTQSALLEAMEEGRITSGTRSFDLPRPFTLIGTQNPIEMEGTYPLPEAQLDRFALHLAVEFPDPATLEAVLGQRASLAPELPPAVLSPSEVLELQRLSEQVLVAPHLLAWLSRLLLASQPVADGTVKLGASPRAGIAMLRIARMRALLGLRFHVSREDLVDLAVPAFRHRILLSYEARARGIGVSDLVAQWIATAGDS